MSDQAELSNADQIFGVEEVEEVVEKTELDAEETTEEVESEDDETETTELDDAEGAKEEAEQEDEDDTVLFLDLDGEEVSLDEVRGWKEGHMLRDKYTQQRMVDARVEKQNKSESVRLEAESNRIKATVTALEPLLARLKNELGYSDEEMSAFNESIAGLTQSLEVNKEAAANDFAADERALLFKRNKDWLDDNDELSEKGQAEIKTINTYFKDEQFTQAEVGGIVSHKLMMAIHKAAKYDALKRKTVSLKRKVKKVPVVSKPKSTPKAPEAISAEDLVFGT